MRRTQNTYRHKVGTANDMFRLIPISRRTIAPGTSFRSFGAEIKVTSAQFNRWHMSDALLQAYAFYVPYRLLWDRWEDFVAGVSPSPSIPVANGVPWDDLFEGANSNTFGRRAFKLIYNQYFGQKDVSWYDDIEDDTDVTHRSLRVWDQWLGSATTEPPVEEVYQAVVNGNEAAIPLNEFARRMRDARSRAKSTLTGNKYVDSMLAMGVELDWRIQNAPEFLGSVTHRISPVTNESTEAQDLDAQKVRYRGKVQLAVKSRKSFAEHGVVMILAALRPATAPRSYSSQDSQLFSRSQFFMGDNDNVYDKSGELYHSRLSIYRKGRDLEGTNLVSAKRPWLTNDYQSSAELMYPNPSQFLVSEDWGGNQLALWGDVAYDELTPVPGDRV